jgi:hypothetical protein
LFIIDWVPPMLLSPELHHYRKVRLIEALQRTMKRLRA